MISVSHWGMFELPLPAYLSVVGYGEYGPIVAYNGLAFGSVAVASPSAINDFTRRLMSTDDRYDSKYLHG